MAAPVRRPAAKPRIPSWGRCLASLSDARSAGQVSEEVLDDVFLLDSDFGCAHRRAEAAVPPGHDRGADEIPPAARGGQVVGGAEAPRGRRNPRKHHVIDAQAASVEVAVVAQGRSRGRQLAQQVQHGGATEPPSAFVDNGWRPRAWQRTADTSGKPRSLLAIGMLSDGPGTVTPRRASSAVGEPACRGWESYQDSGFVFAPAQVEASEVQVAGSWSVEGFASHIPVHSGK